MSRRLVCLALLLVASPAWAGDLASELMKGVKKVPAAKTVKAKKCPSSLGGKLYVVDYDFALDHQDTLIRADGYWLRSPALDKLFADGDSSGFDEPIFAVFRGQEDKGFSGGLYVLAVKGGKLLCQVPVSGAGRNEYKEAGAKAIGTISSKLTLDPDIPASKIGP